MNKAHARNGGLRLASPAFLAALSAVAGCPSDNGGNGGNGQDIPKVETSYGGRAVLVRAKIAGAAETTLVDTGEMPEEGGALEASGLTLNLPSVVSADIAHATVVAGNGTSSAEAALSNIDIQLGDHRVTADFLMARAATACTGLAAAGIGDVLVSNLTIDGDPTAVTVAPNQEFPLTDLTGARVGRILINQQLNTTENTTGKLTVNGLRIQINGGTDVILFQAQAETTCAVSVPSDDFLTGGGFIDHSGSPAFFALAGGQVGDALWGHLEYIDKDADLRVRGTGVTGYSIVDPSTRMIVGNCEINGQAGFTYEALAADLGKPGSGDTLSIALSNGYQASGGLVGGDLQIHESGR